MAGTELSLAKELGTRKAQFEAALKGSGVHPDKFMRVALTAAQQDPTLQNADPRSFINACMRAAQDGLVPDGRDGAFVPFDGKVTWMPMFAGIQKRVRKSGEVTTWDIYAVYAKDHFDYELGDDPYIKHKPYMPEPLPRAEDEPEEKYVHRLRLHVDRGPMTYVYSVAQLKGGHLSRDVMSRAEVEYVRDTYARKDKKGQFSPAWRKAFSAMAIKTIGRRHAKMLPVSTEIVALLHRDDDLYDLKDEPRERIEAPRDLSDRLDFLAGSYDPETGEVISERVLASTPTAQNAAPSVDPSSRRVPEPEGAAPPPEPPPPPAEPPPIEGDEGDFPIGDPGPPDEPLLIDEPVIPIEVQGERMAKKGRRELERWITQLPADTQAHVSLAQIAAWRGVANKVGK